MRHLLAAVPKVSSGWFDRPRIKPHPILAVHTFRVHKPQEVTGNWLLCLYLCNRLNNKGLNGQECEMRVDDQRFLAQWQLFGDTEFEPLYIRSH